MFLGHIYVFNYLILLVIAMPNKKAKGPRAKTRDLLKNKRKVAANSFIQDFKIGTRVAIRINSSIHSGMPSKRFHGKSGVIAKKKGKCYVVETAIGDADKTITVSPVHLLELKGATK